MLILVFMIVMTSYAVYTYQKALPRNVVLDRQKIKSLSLHQSFSKVNEILGLAPGDYTGKKVYKEGALVINVGKLDSNRPQTVWQDDKTYLLTQFDDDNELTFAIAYFQSDGSVWNIARRARSRDD